MVHFLVKKGNELHVTPVPPAEEDTFRLLYHGYILAEGTSVLDVLRQFDEMPLVIEEAW